MVLPSLAASSSSSSSSFPYSCISSPSIALSDILGRIILLTSSFDFTFFYYCFWRRVGIHCFPWSSRPLLV